MSTPTYIKEAAEEIVVDYLCTDGNPHFEGFVNSVAEIILKHLPKVSEWECAEKYETDRFIEDDWKLGSCPEDVFKVKWNGVLWEDIDGNDCYVSHVMPLPPPPIPKEEA